MPEFKGEQQPDITPETEPVKSEEEFRAEQAKKVVKFLKRIHAYEKSQEILSDEEEVPDFEDFQKFMVRLNGIAREIPVQERVADGENVYLSGGLGDEAVPRHEDKEELLKYAYEAIPEITKEDARYLLPAMVNAVHLFADGNGRTSRILYQLLTKYPSEKEFLEETEKALQKSGRYDTKDINPGLIRYELKLSVLEKYGWVEDKQNGWKINGIPLRFRAGEVSEIEKLPQGAKKFFELDKLNRHYAQTAIYAILGEEGIKEIVSDDDPRKYAISPAKMVKTLAENQWEQLVDYFYQLKKEETENLVNAFKEPEKYKTTKDGQEITVRDAFIKEIERKK